MTKNNYKYILKWAKKIKAINLLGGKCEICGEDNVFCLQFHHNGSKLFEIGKSIGRGDPWSVIEGEVKKCNLLCTNCHYETLYGGESKRSKLKEYLLNIKGNKCEKCGYAGKNTASLVFHHRDPSNKLFTLGYVYGRNGITNEIMDNILLEIEKCDILCANCHKKMHGNDERFLKLESLILEKSNNLIVKKPLVDREMVKKMYLDDHLGILEIARIVNCAKSTVSRMINHVLNCKKGA